MYALGRGCQWGSEHLWTQPPGCWDAYPTLRDKFLCLIESAAGYVCCRIKAVLCSAIHTANFPASIQFLMASHPHA